MINDEECLKRFGYTYDILSPSSTKNICIKCDFCLSNFVRKKYHMKKPGRSEFPHACRKCDQIKSNWKKNNKLKLNPRDFFKSYEKNDLSRVDIESTIEKYGYDPKNLGPRSEKSVIVICEFCRNKFGIKLSNLKKGDKDKFICCKKCRYISVIFKKSKETDKHEFWKSCLSEHKDYRECIDKKKTIDELEYDPDELSPKSEKPVFVFCHFCRNSFKISRISYLFSQKGILSCVNCRNKKNEMTLLEKYGVRNSLSIPDVQDKLKNPLTERIVCSILMSMNIKYEREWKLGPYSFDIYLPDHNLLIECQGDHWHDFKNKGYLGTSKDKAKSTYVEKYSNHKLLWIWEHEIHSGRIRKILGRHLIHDDSDEIIVNDKSKIEIKISTNLEAYRFLSLYHYLGNLGTALTPYGAYYEGKLIAITAIGGITRKSSVGKINKETNNKFHPFEVKELRRFCIRPNLICKNLASYLLARVIKLIDDKIKVITSFADPDVGDLGGIYKASNWIRLSDSSKSYHYIDPVTSKPIHKRTVYGLAKSSHMIEKEFVKSAGYLKVQENEKYCYIKIR